MTGKVVTADFRPHVTVAVRGKVRDLGPDAVGTPVEELFGEAVPPSLRGCKRFMTEDGPVRAKSEAPTNATVTPIS